MNNVFLLHGLLPNTPIKEWNVRELCYLHKHQFMYSGDSIYIDEIIKIIKEKIIMFDEEHYTELFHGDGCCSEYRNSVRFQVERLKEMINEKRNSKKII